MPLYTMQFNRKEYLRTARLPFCLSCGGTFMVRPTPRFFNHTTPASETELLRYREKTLLVPCCVKCRILPKLRTLIGISLLFGGSISLFTSCTGVISLPMPFAVGIAIASTGVGILLVWRYNNPLVTNLRESFITWEVTPKVDALLRETPVTELPEIPQINRCLLHHSLNYWKELYFLRDTSFGVSTIHRCRECGFYWHEIELNDNIFRDEKVNGAIYEEITDDDMERFTSWEALTRRKSTRYDESEVFRFTGRRFLLNLKTHRIIPLHSDNHTEIAEKTPAQADIFPLLEGTYWGYDNGYNYDNESWSAYSGPYFRKEDHLLLLQNRYRTVLLHYRGTDIRLVRETRIMNESELRELLIEAEKYRLEYCAKNEIDPTRNIEYDLICEQQGIPVSFMALEGIPEV